MNEVPIYDKNLNDYVTETKTIPQAGQNYNYINYPTNDICVWDVPEYKRHCQFCAVQFCGLRKQQL